MDKQLKELYKKLISNNLTEIKDGKLTFARYKNGSKFEESNYKLMYIGRALNGWFRLDGDNEEEIYESAVEKVQNERIKEFGGTIKRSAFWQLCKLILNEKGDYDENDWDERIVWSNLYKLAPVKGGNPNYSTIKKTLENCVEILKREIEIVKPRHIVMVTGDWWVTLREKEEKSKFEKTFETEFDIKFNNYDSFVIGKGNYNGIPIVVTQRPERRRATREKQAKEVVNAFLE